MKIYTTLSILLFVCLNYAMEPDDSKGCLNSSNRGPLDGLQWGLVKVKNTLQEPILCTLQTVLNGTEKHFRTYCNQERRYDKTIMPGEIVKLSAGIEIAGQMLYGSIIRIYLQKKSQEIKNDAYLLTLTEPVGFNTIIDVKSTIDNYERRRARREGIEM